LPEDRLLTEAAQHLRVRVEVRRERLAGPAVLTVRPVPSRIG